MPFVKNTMSGHIFMITDDHWKQIQSSKNIEPGKYKLIPPPMFDSIKPKVKMPQQKTVFIEENKNHGEMQEDRKNQEEEVKKLLHHFNVTMNQRYSVESKKEAKKRGRPKKVKENEFNNNSV